MSKPSYHSICRWTFNSGKGGFTPGNIRPGWAVDKFTTADFIQLAKEQIAPKLPEEIVLGVEMHYDYEFNEQNAAEVADALADTGIYLAMTTPGAHAHFGYGGIASLDPAERDAAAAFGRTAVDLTYESLKKGWHPDAGLAPTLVIWNGSFGYDIASVGISEMYKNLKQGLADLCKYEQSKGGHLYIGLEPKPNEGHPAMLLPTVSSTIVLINKLKNEFGINNPKLGVNKEFGHSEMIGLDHVLDTVEEIDNHMLVHMHLNSQGYNDGVILGGPGKFDIDHGTRINGMNIAIAGLTGNAGYNRWKGHDMQARPYDNEEQAVDRVVRSILSWHACELAASELNEEELLQHLQNRDTARAEDMIRHLVSSAFRHFDELYQ